jgi:hypothetical protein
MHTPAPLFAIEVEPSSSDLTENLAIYRRLTARQKAAIAAELRRKVETEIAQARRPSPRRRNGVITKFFLTVEKRSWMNYFFCSSLFSKVTRNRPSTGPCSLPGTS